MKKQEYMIIIFGFGKDIDITFKKKIMFKI